MFQIEFAGSAITDLRYFRKSEQNLIIDSITQSLIEPLLPARNRNHLEPNDLSEWELRVGKNRVFYDIDANENVVEIDDFDEEVEMISKNPELRALLKERSKETERYSLQQVREILELD